MNLDQDKIARLTPWLMQNIRSDDVDAKDMSDYVISLLTSAGTPEQLFDRCCSELEEFLGPQTRGFVESLFSEINQQNQPQPAPAPMLSGGQEQLRRNFRPDFAAVPPNQGFPQGNQFPNQFPHQMNNRMPSQPFGVPPGAQHAPGMPPQFGFQGFGKPAGHTRMPRANHNQRSQLSSVQNEISVANKRLVVEKIPPENMNEDAINAFFGKFGELTNIKLNPQQNLAEIEFAGHDQALAAHRSPEPIFGNRFVKVFWRKKLENEAEPELDIEAVRRMQAVKQQQFQEREARRKNLTAQLKQVMQDQVQVLQERQRLLTSGESTPEQQNALQERSNELQQQTNQLKQDLATLSGGGASTRGGFRGRSAFRGARTRASPMGRGGANAMSFRTKIATASLDRRPKNVMLSGVGEANEEVLKSELAVRNYTNFSRNDSETVTVSFPDRQTAEEFFKVDLPDMPDVRKQWVNDAEVMAE